MQKSPKEESGPTVYKSGSAPEESKDHKKNGDKEQSTPQLADGADEKAFSEADQEEDLEGEELFDDEEDGAAKGQLDEGAGDGMQPISDKFFYKEMAKIKEKSRTTGAGILPPKKSASAYIIFQKEVSLSF